jgi:hypothetical protein
LVEDLQGHLAATVWLIWFLHADIPEGIMTDIESSFLNGWTCYLEEPYPEEHAGCDLTAIPQQANFVFVGARSPEGVITLGAVGSRDEVIKETEKNKPHLHNGVWWYFTPDAEEDEEAEELGGALSFGFSPSSSISQSSADTIGTSNHRSEATGDECEGSKLRLSWHLGVEGGGEGGRVANGWRAGTKSSGWGTGLSAWKKLVYWM